MAAPLRLAPLAALNAAGFSATTLMPLWLGLIASYFRMPPSFAGAAVLAQVGGAAVSNLLTPLLLPRARPRTHVRVALLLASAGNLLAVTGGAAGFMLGATLCGLALGSLLTVTNRLLGSAEHVQQGYAIFVLIEVCFATLLFLGGTEVLTRFGLRALFELQAGILLLALLLTGALPAERHRAAAVNGGARGLPLAPAVLGLGALGLFFVGQSTLNAFMPTLGARAGLDAATAGRTIGLGMPFGFAGAMLARLIGERVPPAVPVLGTIAVLAAAAPLLTFNLSYWPFIVTIVALATSTMFSLPYFFAQLGTYERTGRYTAYGPAMMLAGVGIGPSAAVILDARFGTAAVALFSCVLLLLAAAAFLACVGLEAGRVRA